MTESGQEESNDREEAAREAELAERRRAALARIVQFGDPVLKSRASEITEFGPALGDEAAGMIELMREAWGCGLAGNQVGRLRRIVVFQPSSEDEATALVNPVAESLSEEASTMLEGCLSIPDVVVEVERPLAGRFSAFDLGGERIELELEGLATRILLHEIDHLDGILILDRTSPEHRRAALGALRRGESWAPPNDGEETPEEALA